MKKIFIFLLSTFLYLILSINFVNLCYYLPIDITAMENFEITEDSSYPEYLGGINPSITDIPLETEQICISLFPGFFPHGGITSEELASSFNLELLIYQNEKKINLDLYEYSFPYILLENGITTSSRLHVCFPRDKEDKQNFQVFILDRGILNNCVFNYGIYWHY